jgi:hypothetical protein
MLRLMSNHVGRAWYSKAQVDVVVINSMEKTLILGECKWTLAHNERKVMAELVKEKTGKIIPARGRWKVYFVGFSRSGWTSGALVYQAELNKQPVQGEDWLSTRMRLVSIDELDDDLTIWTKERLERLSAIGIHT